MRPQIQKLPLSEQSSFMADVFFTPYFETPWHYHPEYELALIIEGNGKRFIGNHVGDFQPGDLCFIGSNLPHLYRKEDAAQVAGSLVIHFTQNFLGSEFIKIPEMQKVNLMLSKAAMGMQLKGVTRLRVAQLMNDMLELQGMDRLINLFKILQDIAARDEYELLSSPEIRGHNRDDSDRLNNVFDHVMKNFRDDITLDGVAKLANMSTSGFCRYFKKRTKKNFTHFVNEIRIGYACRRLIESDLSAEAICYESGYNNKTHFMQQFKKIVMSTPHQFRKAMARDR
jgi:AraC-like DNA-binding protein/quercetin dioxygenase-like cupin family protein